MGGRCLQRTPQPVSEPDESALRLTADLIRAAHRPVLLVGHGVVRQGAAPALRELCRKTGLHVITTFMGKGVLDADNEHFLFTAGLNAQNYPAGFFGRADLVICVGYDMVEWAPSAWNPAGDRRIICIDTVTPEIDAHDVPEVELVGDLTHIIAQLGFLLAAEPPTALEVPPYHRAFEVALDVGGDDDAPVKPQRVLRDLREAHGHRRHPRIRRRRSQALGGALLGGSRAQDRAHLQRLRGDGLRPAGRHRRRAHGARLKEGRDHRRRRRLPHERGRARDRQAAGQPPGRAHLDRWQATA